MILERLVFFTRELRSVCIVVSFFLLSLGKASGQTTSLSDDLLRMTKASDSLNQKKPSENIYIQFDKPYYAVGDTIWFKAYLLNEALSGSNKSGFMYFDIANETNKIIAQYKFPLINGMGPGNITLNDKEFAAGTYTIRAYTNWMRNFGDQYFFYRRLYISSPDENNLLVNKQETLSAANSTSSFNVKLRFSEINNKPYAAQSLDLAIMAGRTNLAKQKFQTDSTGLVSINFVAPQKSPDIKIIARGENGKMATIPLTLNRPERTDLQFLPESGNLLAGIRSRIGFKALSEDGKGINISGTIIDHEQKQVAVFKSLHNGMGSFDLSPKNGEEYTAIVTSASGVVKKYLLPEVKTSGIVLQIKNPMESDSVEVFVNATKDIILSGNKYFLIGRARGIICYAAIVDFKNSKLVQNKIAKKLFPTGVTHFTLMTLKYQPLNERLVFIDHKDNLNIQLKTDKSNYSVKDSVGLQIKVTDNAGKPVAGNFSLAVTDDAQVKTDTLNTENLAAHFLFMSDLKGYIEEPGYYFPLTDSNKWVSMDNLLLTQGWTRFDWQQVLKPPALSYEAEHEFSVKGNIVTFFNKPVKGTDVLLFSKSPSIIMDTATDNEGRFMFHHFPVVDSPLFIIKAVNKRGKSFNVRVNVDEIAPPPFTAPGGPLIIPWYVNSDTALINYTRTNGQMQSSYLKGKHMLKEVKITAKKIVKDSQNLNGPGNADQVIDEKELEKAGKKNWLQLLQANIQGFREVAHYVNKHIWVNTGGGAVTDVITHFFDHWYYVKDKRVEIIVDGIVLDSAFAAVPTFDDETRFLESHNAEDIKGIELSLSPKYSFSYIQRFIPKENYDPILIDYVFIEITTRSGKGPFFDNTPGMYFYRPLAISWPKQFYSPRYIIKDTSNIADSRSTIDWKPNIITDVNGEAKLSFYTANKQSTYSFTIEGIDGNGELGFKREKVRIGKFSDKSKTINQLTPSPHP